MEEKSTITVINKEKMIITGVNRIHGFNSLNFDIDTILGELHIEGNNLEMEKLDDNTKELYINGSIHKVYYQETKHKKDSFFKKLIK